MVLGATGSKSGKTHPKALEGGNKQSTVEEKKVEKM